LAIETVKEAVGLSLAIEGGERVRKEPFPPRIQVGPEELQAVVDLMKGYMAIGGAFDRYGGTQVEAYEKEFAMYHGLAFATATSSGTAAIHAALGALRLDIGSEVISSPITDPGAVAPILFQNCIPIFADADPETFNMNPESVKERISDRTKAIIVGHIAGQPCDMGPIMEIAEDHDLTVIEDCSQAHDAIYKGRKTGTIGHIGAFSLMSGKHTTSGGQGGMVITSNEELYLNAKRFADRGKPFGSTMQGNMFLGNNYRMTELEAAIGRVQLKKMPKIVEARRKIVANIEEEISDLKAVRLGKIIEGAVSSYWFVFLRVDESKLKVNMVDFGKAVAAEGVPVGGKYEALVCEQPWIRDRQTYGQSQCPWCCPFWGKEVTYEGSCPNARRAIDTHILMGVHEGYTEREVKDIATALKKVESHYLN
jgi:perosamine synthetase